MADPIQDAASIPPVPDFATLRDEALDAIRLLAARTWTDHNLHDPGITILEQLCYTLTDLAYRIDFDIRDLLAPNPGESPEPSLFTPAEILTSTPVTFTDLRKLIIDVDGVKNAWLEPVEVLEPALFQDPSDDTLYLESASHRKPVALAGVYRVLVEADGTRADLEVARAVFDRIHANRSLGQDFEWPFVLKRQEITVQAEIEVDEIDDPDRLLAKVYSAVASYLSPRIRFYTLTEMLAKGRTIDEIMNGPALEHGFIDTQELEDFDRKIGLRTSDLVHVIMDIEGVRGIHELTLSDDASRESWYLPLDPSRTPTLNLEGSLNNGGAIHLRRGKLRWESNREAVLKALDDLPAIGALPTLSQADRDLPLPVGNPRDVQRYVSFQRHLPRTYGIGAAGLPAGVPEERHARARQLKAYLMFFDQVLANCFSQVGNLRHLFSFERGPRATYYSQIPSDVPGFEEVLSNLDAGALQALTEDDSNASSRRERMLNHLLARFAEEFADFGMIEDPVRRVDAKAAFLQDYRATSVGRSRAFNYTIPSWETDNLSGLERRIAWKLGISTIRRRALAGLKAEDEGGFHMIEHLLLRPQKEDADQWQLGPEGQWRANAFLAHPERMDPYSTQVTFVFPAWILRFREEQHAFVETTIREETPAHLSTRVLWLQSDTMKAFEAAFQTWLEGRVAAP